MVRVKNPQGFLKRFEKNLKCFYPHVFLAADVQILSDLSFSTELIDISRFCPLFSAHLQTCVDRQVLPVASDTVDFMLSKKMTVDGGMLQMLLHKLGKQSLWLKAREVFRRECFSVLRRKFNAVSTNDC